MITLAIAYPLTTQLTCVSVHPSEVWMFTSATFTMLVSMISIRAPSDTPMAMIHFTAPSLGAVLGIVYRVRTVSAMLKPGTK